MVSITLDQFALDFTCLYYFAPVIKGSHQFAPVSTREVGGRGIWGVTMKNVKVPA